MTEKLSPRHDFTFFPDPHEQEMLAAADVDTLQEIFEDNPDLIPEFLHELWRTHRTADIEEICRRMPQFSSENEELIIPSDEIFDGTVRALVLMRYSYGVDNTICQDYLSETWIALASGYSMNQYGEALTDTNREEIQLVSTNILTALDSVRTNQRRIDRAHLN